MSVFRPVIPLPTACFIFLTIYESLAHHGSIGVSLWSDFVAVYSLASNHTQTPTPAWQKGWSKVSRSRKSKNYIWTLRIFLSSLRKMHHSMTCRIKSRQLHMRHSIQNVSVESVFHSGRLLISTYSKSHTLYYAVLIVQMSFPIASCWPNLKLTSRSFFRILKDNWQWMMCVPMHMRLGWISGGRCSGLSAVTPSSQWWQWRGGIIVEIHLLSG